MVSIPAIASETSPGVFHCREWGVTLDSQILAELIDAARTNARARARLCLHPEPEDIEQQMLIVMVEGAVDAAHKHPAKREALLPILGTAEYQLFGDSGILERRIAVGGTDSMYVSSPLNTFHRLVLKEPIFAFWEVAQGPFASGSTVPALWREPLDSQVER
jgi:cupin fold WbuC family metalloprotein